MTLDSFIDLMHTLGVTYDPNGNQEIVLWWNLDGMCQQIRGAYAKRITVSRIDIARILDAKITEVAGC